MTKWRRTAPVLFLLASLGGAPALSPGGGRQRPTRRDVVAAGPATALLLSSALPRPPAAAAESQAAVGGGGGGGAGGGLAARLSQRDPASLKNSVFNVPPAAQVYPDFVRGEWEVTERFAGYIFPSEKVPKASVAANPNVPGFQKCSIAAIGDIGVGGDAGVTYRRSIDAATGREDRRLGLTSSLDAHLGYRAVEGVAYDGDAAGGSPNRLSITMVPRTTRNAERIELFCNARDCEIVPSPRDPNLRIFVCSEHVRQVTFGLSAEFGVARQVAGNYAHYWTWREQEGGRTLTGNVLTAAYLDPQDPQYFDEPSKPVVVYSHNLEARRLA